MDITRALGKGGCCFSSQTYRVLRALLDNRIGGILADMVSIEWESAQ